MSQYVRQTALVPHRRYAHPTGMGAVPGLDGLLAALCGRVEGGLNALVVESKTKTAAIVKAYKDSFSLSAMKRRLLDAVFSDQDSAERWAFQIVASAESIRDTLIKPDAAGKPFYLKHADVASKLATDAKSSLEKEISEFNDAVGQIISGTGLVESFLRFVSDVFDTILSALKQIAKFAGKAVLSPFVLLALGAAGLFVYFKFIRKKKPPASGASSTSTSSNVTPKASTP